MSRQMNGFSVEIPECLEESCDGYATMKHGSKFTIKLNNHHKECGHGKPCDAEVFVDGKSVGAFRLNYGDTIRLEHPVNDFGCFTAYKKGTSEAYQASINANSNEAGLIKVVFNPGKTQWEQLPVHHSQAIKHDDVWWYDSPTINPSPQWNINSNYYYDGGTVTNNCTLTTDTYSSDTRSMKCCASSSKLVSGGVGLSGCSDQVYNEIANLTIDEPPTIIYIRLAFKEDDCPRPLNTVYRPTIYETSKPRPLR